MSVVTSQQINQYFENFKGNDVTFTKNIISSLGLIPNQIFLKMRDRQRPCVLYSSSMVGARVIVGLEKEAVEGLKDKSNHAALRFAFRNSEKGEPINFFVQAKITGLNLYNKEKFLYFASLDYTQRPPDDLIEILGRMLEATVNSFQRKEERIILTSDNLRKIGLASKNAQAFVQKVPRNVIVRDLSFSGAKIIILGNAKFLLEKEIQLVLRTANTKHMILAGKIIRHEAVEGRKDIAALAVLFHEEKIPLDYKMMINNFLQSSTSR